MLTAAVKQLPWMLALFVLGPIAGHLVGSLRAPDGSTQATLLVTTAPASGVVAGAVVLAFALAVGVFGSKVNGCRSGLNAAGIVLAWSAAQTATIDALIRRAQGPAPLMALAVEGLAFGVLAVPVVAIVWRAGLGRGQHAEAHPLPLDGEGRAQRVREFVGASARGARGLRPEHESLGAALIRATTRPAGLGAVGVTIAAGILVSYLVCQDTLKGQAIFAAALAGVLAVPAGRLAGETLKEQPPMAAFALGFALLGLVGPLAARFMHTGSIVADTYAGGLIGVACPVTLDWLAGACIGLPIGEAWFVSMFKPASSHAATSSAAR